MDFMNTLRIALRALSRNKLRSALTMLGIIIGVGAVIATVSIGQGAEYLIQQGIESLGTNAVFIAAGSNRAGARTGFWGVRTLTVEDMEAILREVPLIRSAAPVVFTRAQVVYQNQNWRPRIEGTTPEYFQIRRWGVQAGGIFSEDEVRSAANVCVLGVTVARMLFGNQDPIGQTIRIGEIPFRVVGVLEAKGQSAMGEDQDDRLIAPYTTVQRKIAGITWIHYINASAITKDAAQAAVPQIEALLRERHRIRNPEDDDFFVSTQSDVAEMATQTERVMNLLLGSIASVSLIVGGIGIMNIMLVSVTERTREIGVRMAVGATEADVRRQFLVEAVTMSMAGGVIGIASGLVGSWAIAKFLGWPTLISATAIVIATVVAAGIGILFGIYPAWKAAQLDPIEALRYE
ncbi:MAG: ABC transporter permease [Acidobacteriia bacterium]|jgi:putative ABC transport system permease protein|nr:ABC transporter permease [Terriglobia bacterium]